MNQCGVEITDSVLGDWLNWQIVKNVLQTNTTVNMFASQHVWWIFPHSTKTIISSQIKTWNFQKEKMNDAPSH